LPFGGVQGFVGGLQQRSSCSASPRPIPASTPVPGQKDFCAARIVFAAAAQARELSGQIIRNSSPPRWQAMLLLLVNRRQIGQMKKGIMVSVPVQ
jgi:hypothetical protein